MKITTVLFDLDGTLLPMDQDQFTEGYFKLLVKKVVPVGFEPKELIDAIWAGTAAMVKNDGSTTNEAVFWDCFRNRCGDKVTTALPLFEEFYEKEFNDAKVCCGFTAKACSTINQCKEMGLRVALATNPIFPAVATQARIRWAGLSSSDFELYTTYENSCYCKPNLNYYRDIIQKLKVSAEECLMVGNDVSEDMVVQELGMHVFLLTDCLINKENKDINNYPHGGFDELLAYLKANVQ